jgi:hypothetical protein
MLLGSNRIHWNEPKGERVRWAWQSSRSRFACLALLSCFQEAAGFDERKGSDTAESSTSSKVGGRFRSMNPRLFIGAGGTAVGESAAAGAEQRRDRLWLPRAWPNENTREQCGHWCGFQAAPSPAAANGCCIGEGGGVWSGGGAQQPPFPPRTLLARWPPSAWYDRNTFLHAGHSYRVRFCAIGGRASLSSPSESVTRRGDAGGGGDGQESRESMTSDIATSSSGVAPSDTELTGSASPDPAPAWPPCLALGDEGEKPVVSLSRSEKSDSARRTRRLGFSRSTYPWAGFLASSPPATTEVEADDAEEICDDLAAAMECARMCPARARGLAKRREQSLHVFLAMAGDPGELDESTGELSPPKVWSFRSRRRESCCTAPTFLRGDGS